MFIHRSQRQEIKAGIFSIIGLFYVFPHIFMPIPLPGISENTVFETDDLKDEGYYCVFSLFFSFPLLSSLLSLLTAFLGTDVEDE